MITHAALVAMGGVIVIGGAVLGALRERVRTLEAQALTDPLTGAFNRRHMDGCLDDAIERRTRYGEPASLVLFDVDRFKRVNDLLGHGAGDAVLKALVTLVRRRIRRVDVLFRTGGEEFAVLLSGAGFGAALGIAEQLRALVAASRLLDEWDVSISAGVSELRPGQTAREWMDEADRALLRAKLAGRNRVAGIHPLRRAFASPADERSYRELAVGAARRLRPSGE